MAHNQWTGSPSGRSGPHSGSSGSESAADKARSAVDDAAEQARANLLRAAEHQKNSSAGQIGGIADAVHRAARELERELPQGARYIHQAAGWLDSASSSLRQRKVDELLGTFVRFCRQQPATVIGLAALAGLAASELLKGSRETPAGPQAASAGREAYRHQPLVLVGIGLALGAAASAIVFPAADKGSVRK